jgi:acyl-CoA synthetase (AMP-forming)/AMP-acid ligase II
VSDPAQVVAAARNGRRRCLTASPFMHGTGHWMALTTLLEGGTVVVVRDTRLDADGLLEVAAREAVTMLVIVGDAFGRPLVDALAAREDRDDLSTLNVIVSGGAALSPSTTADLLRLLPWTMVVDGFGASETGGQGQRVSYPGAPPTSSGDRRFLMRPDTTVVDDELRPLEPGDGRTGWLARRGRVPLGYLDDPEGTARTFPVVGGVRWALPGDRASIEADGTISVHGRGSSTISTGGETVHAEEVESVVRAHPDVLDAVVVGVPDPRWEEVVTAVASVRPGRDLTVQSLDAHCRPASRATSCHGASSSYPRWCAPRPARPTCAGPGGRHRLRSSNRGRGRQDGGVGVLIRDGLEVLIVVAVGGMLAAAVGRLRRGEVRVYRCFWCDRPTSRAYPRCRHCDAEQPTRCDRPGPGAGGPSVPWTGAGPPLVDARVAARGRGQGRRRAGHVRRDRAPLRPRQPDHDVRPRRPLAAAHRARPRPRAWFGGARPRSGHG